MKSGLVAIAGRPNSGKSTLLNRVLGTELSITSPKPQTTRDRTLGILTGDLGQIVFVDTPGIHRAREGGINSYMVNEARLALDGPDAVWYLVDPASSIEHEAPVIDLLAKASRQGVFLLMNKADAVRANGIELRASALEDSVAGALEAAGIAPVAKLRIAGKRGQGVEDLLARTWEMLPEGPALFPDGDTVSDRPVRYFAGEMIREQLFQKLGDEIPYSCAVSIDKFQDPPAPGGLTRIEATIHVERESQKGMVVGAGGKKIKEIGMGARARIERFIEGKAFLGLTVKVLPDWTRNSDALKRLGYALPPERAGRAR